MTYEQFLLKRKRTIEENGFTIPEESILGIMKKGNVIDFVRDGHAWLKCAQNYKFYCLFPQPAHVMQTLHNSNKFISREGRRGKQWLSRGYNYTPAHCFMNPWLEAVSQDEFDEYYRNFKHEYQKTFIK